MLSLRPYQQECLDSIIQNFNAGNTRQLISLPTGSGKTVVFSHLIQQKNCRALVLAHTIELLQQSCEKIEMVCPGLNVGLVNAHSKEFNNQVVVSSIQSARLPENLTQLQAQDFQLLIYDEAHRAASDSARHVIDSLGFGKGTNKLITGYTATAFRSDHRGLGEVFDVVSYQKKIKEMIDEGYLCRPRGIKIATDIDLSKVKMSGSDFEAESLAAIMDTHELNQLIINSYLKEGEGRQTICFSVTVQHAKNLSSLFREHGVSSEVIHGTMSKDGRDEILKQYKAGKIRVLVNCAVLVEGFDAPQTSCILIAKPTQSRGLFQQMAGRGLRLYPNKKDCLILDICTKNHSLCSTAQLLEDEIPEHVDDKETKDKQKELIEKLPPNLNQKLKSALLHFDPLGESFTWSQEDGIYILKGVGKTRLSILPTIEDRFRVVLSSEKGNQIIADNLNFEYAFSCGEDFAKANKSTFVICDREASWRDFPASERQINFIRSKTRCRVGLDRLTRGQASDLIGSLRN